MKKVLSNYTAVEKIILYGSKAKGNYSKWSDINITLVGTSIHLSLLMKIETELDDLLMPYKIDTSILDFIENNDLGNYINRVGLTFHEKAVDQQQLS